MSLQLLILRHGHAVRDSPVEGGDFARPLRGRGRRSVRALAPAVTALHPDLVLSSPSERTRETVERLSLDSPVQYLAPLYLADTDELLDAVREVGADDTPIRTVLLVGHNPGLHQLILELTAGEQVPVFPPAALAVLELDVDDWQQAAAGTAHLVSLHMPPEPQD